MESSEINKIFIAKSRNWVEEENFQEAVKFAHKAFIDPARVFFWILQNNNRPELGSW